MSSLASFLTRFQSGLPPEQQSHVREREADRLAMAAPDWSSLCAMPIDLVMVREAHRYVSKKASVRRADREGEWTVASSQAGKLRSQPQSFRVGDHVEPAWDHGSLKRRLADLVNTTRDAAVTDPLAAAASLVRGFARAQPFLGENERVALVVASLLLRSATLPALHAEAVESAPAFARALVAPDDEPMVRLLAEAVWQEALELVESIAVTPSRRWTLAAEHAALNAARARASSMTDAHLVELCEVVEQALAPQLQALFGSAEATHCAVHASFSARASAAIRAVYRGRQICAQRSIVEMRWSFGALDAVLVVALAGRGISGAASAHVAFELPSLPANTRRAPGLLLLPDEAHGDLERRLTGWLPSAIDEARRGSPLAF